MRTIQEIFDTVIDHGHYHSRMCIALIRAKLEGTITQEEKRVCDVAINGYLAELCQTCAASPYVEAFLKDALKLAGLPSSEEYRLKIYRNWAARPRPFPYLHKGFYRYDPPC